jgi:hypothetical protein
MDMADGVFLEAIGEHQATFRAPTDTSFNGMDRLGIDIWDLSEVLASNLELGLQEHFISSASASTGAPQFTGISSDHHPSPSTGTST